MAWLSFIELDKAVVHVIRLTSLLSLWFVCLPSDASHNTYRLTWVSLTLDVGDLFMAAPAKRSCCSLPWTRYPISEVRGGSQEDQLHIQGAVAAQVQEGREELLHVQDQEGQP